MNAELLRKVARRILADSRTFDMYEWIALAGDHQMIMGQPCGTVACIAGHICILGGFSVGFLDSMEDEQPDRGLADSPIAVIARGLLQISAPDALRLFLVRIWPRDLAVRYEKANESKDSAECARIAVDRINAFLIEKGYAPALLDSIQQEGSISVPTFTTL